MKNSSRQVGTSGRGLNVMIVAAGVFLAGLAGWFFLFVPTQTPEDNRTGVSVNANHIDVISDDPAGIKDGILETRCYTAETPVGYGTTATDGCAAVLAPKHGGGTLTAVYISQHWEEGSFDQAYSKMVKTIEELKESNPKVKLVGSKRTTISGNDVWVIDYKDPYDLSYRNYLIKAPEGKFSYNGQSLVAFSVTGYISEEQFVGSEPPVDVVASSIQLIK